jgi:hypothetical protein
MRLFDAIVGALLLTPIAYVTAVDLVRAVRSGVATFRIGKWSGPWENPISKSTSPFAFWTAVVWSGLWLVVILVMLSFIAVGTAKKFM